MSGGNKHHPTLYNGVSYTHLPAKERIAVIYSVTYVLVLPLLAAVAIAVAVATWLSDLPFSTANDLIGIPSSKLVLWCFVPDLAYLFKLMYNLDKKYI